LIGDSDDGAVTHSFWDMETSGRTSSQGGSGLTTAELQAPETFPSARWDLAGEVVNGTAETWWMPESGAYPRLSVFSDYNLPALSGQGTAADPYRISYALEIGTLGFYRRAHFRLEKDIDMTGIAWKQAAVPVFEGTLDGNDYAVRHLHIEGGDRLGLFGVIRDGAGVHHLKIQEVTIEGKGDFVGALTGRNDGSLDQCVSTGSVTGSSAVGGLAGLNERGITDCRSTIQVHGKVAVGGLVGENRGDQLFQCYSRGPVTGVHFVGGLVGSSILCDVDGFCAEDSFWDRDGSGVVQSSAGVGRTEGQMQDVETYLAVGWDFVDELANGNK